MSSFPHVSSGNPVVCALFYILDSRQKHSGMTPLGEESKVHQQICLTPKALLALGKTKHLAYDNPKNNIGLFLALFLA
jgi:hypothetical protein